LISFMWFCLPAPLIENSIVLERLPVKFATKLKQDIFGFWLHCLPQSKQFELKLKTMKTCNYYFTTKILS
jgi:hypothetical protein